MVKSKKDLRSQLLDKMKLASKEVEIDGLKVIVTELGAGDYSKLWQDKNNELIVGKELIDGKEVDKTEVDMHRFIACLIAHSCKDAEGNPVFSEEDIDLIKNSNKDIFITLSTACRELNGMTAKNSEATPTE